MTAAYIIRKFIGRNARFVLNEDKHSFEWVIDKEATASEAGLKHEECSVCGYSKEKVQIPALSDDTNNSGDSTAVGIMTLFALTGLAAAALLAAAKRRNVNVFLGKRNLSNNRDSGIKNAAKKPVFDCAGIRRVKNRLFIFSIELDYSFICCWVCGSRISLRCCPGVQPYVRLKKRFKWEES